MIRCAEIDSCAFQDQGRDAYIGTLWSLNSREPSIILRIYTVYPTLRLIRLCFDIHHLQSGNGMRYCMTELLSM